MSLLSNVSSVVDAGVMDHLPDPEVAPKAKPRSFAPAYKKKILAEIEGLDRAELGALLRREGLYSTLIRKWQGQAARDAAGLMGRRPGPKPDPTSLDLIKAQREVARLQAELAKSRRINDVQAKLSALLVELAEGADSERTPTN